MRELTSLGWAAGGHAHVVASLLSAFALGAVIGWERELRQRNAGLRTIVLVTVAAAMFVSMSAGIDGGTGAARVIAYVASGIGFLGGGVILREQGAVRGINTAATLWGAAAVGAACGAAMFFEALLGSALVLCANTALRPLAGAMGRPPLQRAGLAGPAAAPAPRPRRRPRGYVPLQRRTGPTSTCTKLERG